MFLYNIYGKNVIINIKLPLLNNYIDVNKFDLEVIVEFGIVDGDIISIKEKNGQFLVKLGSLAYYCIDPINNVITCTASDFESFFSTFFNIPFSVYCLCQNEILYHACSLIYDGKIFCLTGNKGVGKSTITQILSFESGFEIYGDDTIRVDKYFVVNRAHNLIKHTTETVGALKLNTLDVKNITGKFYSLFDTSLSSGKISKIFHIVRTENKEFDLKQVKSDLIRNSIFMTNVVGISHMPYSLMSKSLKVKPEAEIDFYELFVPNDLNYIIENKEKIKCAFIKSFEN